MEKHFEVFKKGIFVQLPNEIPPKKGSFGQHTHSSWSISLLTYRPLFTHFWAKTADNNRFLGQIRLKPPV